MGPFQLAILDQDRAKRTRRELFDVMMRDRQQAREFTGKDDPSQKEIAEALDKMMEEESKWPIFKNELYQVQVRNCEPIDEGWPEMIGLSIRRLDRAAIHDWREFQEIKNALVGPEHEGFEMYPRESRLVDTANQYFLFVFKDPRITIPVGFMTRSVTDQSLSTSKQRPRK